MRALPGKAVIEMTCTMSGETLNTTVTHTLVNVGFKTTR